MISVRLAQSAHSPASARVPPAPASHPPLYYIDPSDSQFLLVLVFLLLLGGCFFRHGYWFCSRMASRSCWLVSPSVTSSASAAALSSTAWLYGG